MGRARAGTSGRRSPTAPRISGARLQSEPALSCARIAGPSHCGGSPAPRGCASLGVTGLCAATQTPSAWHHCGCSLGQAWRPGRAGLPDARARAVTELVGTVRVSHNSCPPHSLASGPIMLATSPVTTARGGTCAPPPGHLRPLKGGGGGDVPPPGKRRAGPGTEGEGSGTCPHLPPPRMCSVRSILIPTIFHPDWDKQVPSMKLLRWLTVSMPLVTAEAPTVLSLIDGEYKRFRYF